MKNFLFLFFCVMGLNFAYAGSPTANQIMELCSSKNDTNIEACNMFFSGYLEGVVDGGTIVNWNLPPGQNLSAETIKNSFIKLLHDHPIMGDQPVGTVTTFSLVQQGVLKEKGKN